MATLHFLRDFLAYGGEDRPSSILDGQSEHPRTNPQEMRNAVKRLLAGEGEAMTQRVLTGMRYTFPRDCFPDASGVLLAMFQLMPLQVASWVGSTITMLPPGSITTQESQRLANNIDRFVNRSISRSN